MILIMMIMTMMTVTLHCTLHILMTKVKYTCTATVSQRFYYFNSKRFSVR